MIASLQEHFDAYPDPAPETVPIGPGQLDRIDDNLHLGWSWHRYRYTFRRIERPRILDAGCGTGLTSLALARLHPNARVLGLDMSARSLELAADRAKCTTGLDVSFRQQDLEERLPGDLGSFDFIVCRDVLHLANDPVHLLENLARVLDPRGLLLVTIPARGARHAVTQIRRAVATLCPPGASLAEQSEMAGALFQALRPDHPIRRLEALVSGPNGPSAARLIAGYLGPQGLDWDLEDALGALKQAGLKFLYEGSGTPWRPDLIFQSEIPDSLKKRVETTDDGGRAVLIDALDPAANLISHRIYACLSEHEPLLPSWPEVGEPAALDRLIPHGTGLVTPLNQPPGTSVPRPALYRAANGSIAPLDPISDARFRAVDGRLTCAEIDRIVQTETGLDEPPAARQGRWLNLANHGFLLLESPDPRENIPCMHLGPVRDRLDCPCPRKWLRDCDRHKACTIDEVKVDDPRWPVLERALQRRELSQVMACRRCSDYAPEEAIFQDGT